MPTTSVAHIVRRRHNRKQRKRQQQARSASWAAFIFMVLFIALIGPALTAVGVSAWLYLRAAQALPSAADTLYIEESLGLTRLYDRTENVVISRVQDPIGEQRAWLELASLPPWVIQATLTMEDPTYLERDNFNLAATLNQLWAYVLGQPIPRDNSLSARLVRGALLPIARARSGLDDALLSIVLTAEVNRLYTPRALLEWHLNTNDYGSDAYGLEAAAQVYLGKSAAALTLDEAALLAAIPPAPHFNPFKDEAAARGRQADLLRALLASGRVSQQDYNQAIARYTPLRPAIPDAEAIAPDFARYARQQAEGILDGLGLSGARLVSRGGLKIVTTLDLDLYYQAECALRAQLGQLRGQSARGVVTLEGAPCLAAEELESLAALGFAPLSSPPDEGTALLLDVASGQILALVGDALAVRHQPSVVLHPFAALEGLRSGQFTAASMVLDVPQSFAGPIEGLIYTPQNIDGQFRGPLNLRDALVANLLPPIVAVADARGLNRVLNSAHVLGINSLHQTDAYDLSLLERGGQVSLLEVAYAYSVLASGGYMIGVDVEPIARGYRARDAVAVLRIDDSQGRTLWAYDQARQAVSRTNILGSDFSYLLTHLLADQGRREATLGTSLPSLALGRSAAVVNGLSHDLRDNWTVGYTPQRLAAVHLGRRDDASTSLSVYGQEGAAAVWRALLRYAHQRDSLPLADWPRPPDVLEYTVCERSGLLPNPLIDCPKRRELFLRQVPPYQQDTFWQVYEINSQTRQLATAYTPANLRLRSVFFIPPPAAQDWWRANNLPLPPREYDTISRPAALKAVQLFLPANFAYVGGVVDVRGAIDLSAQVLRSYQISYGQGLNPIQWLTIAESASYRDGTSLGQWDTRGLDGIYTLQFSALFADGSRDSDFVQVTIDNQPPQVRLQVGESGQVFRYPLDRSISVLAEVSDNLALERVEFYHNGQLLGVDREWPYGFEFTITRAGEEVFTATAFDQVGNSASAEARVQVAR